MKCLFLQNKSLLILRWHILVSCCNRILGKRTWKGSKKWCVMPTVDTQNRNASKVLFKVWKQFYWFKLFINFFCFLLLSNESVYMNNAFTLYNTFAMLVNLVNIRKPDTCTMLHFPSYVMHQHTMYLVNKHSGVLNSSLMFILALLRHHRENASM